VSGNVVSTNYTWALSYITEPITSIVEIGSRDGLDALSLAAHFKCPVAAFECDPTQFLVTESNLRSSGSPDVSAHEFALTDEDGEIEFWQVDSEKYDVPGTSSLYKVNFDNRSHNDVDAGRGPIQKSVMVRAARFDRLGMAAPGLIAMDVQGAEVRALSGFGPLLNKCRYIICEAERVPSYEGGNSFAEMHRFLKANGFELIASTIGSGSTTSRWWNYWTCNLRIMATERTLHPMRVYQGCFDVIYRNSRRET
jgi:FkbM family methyltransferase